MLISLFFLAACNSSKKALKRTDATLSTLTKDSILTRLNANQIAVEWLSAKTRIAFQDDIQNKKFTSTIRLRKDSVLWMNVKKLSVEAARILIDKDSVYIINRLDKEYYVESLDFLARKYHLPASFDALQTVLLGNPYLIENPDFEVSTSDSQYRLRGEYADGVFSDYWVNGLSFLLEQMSFLDLRYERKLTVGLENYQTNEEGFTFSYQRNFQIESERTGNVAVQFKFVDIEINTPKNMPFAVSSRYKRKKLP